MPNRIYFHKSIFNRILFKIQLLKDVHHGHRGLTPLHACSILLLEADSVTVDDAVVILTMILTPVMTIKMLLNVRQENVQIFSAIVIEKLAIHSVSKLVFVQVSLLLSPWSRNCILYIMCDLDHFELTIY